MTELDRRYFARRAAEELERAEASDEPHARAAHLKLQRAYLEKASVGDREAPEHNPIG